ncbi:hypothetical protein Enr10x_40810 [Gimesia panareensis]|uniref:Uncharacterized protein n=2 Tax=Gimesia panareensis TaxID=2527978 RepID=A0A517QAT1_9PLAN|nr:hypothetical protein Enr10x_40810 [Gimesia panareensis]QDU51585.1 hypothetical protein Pan110_39510 [Gimesia panareensis]
MLQRFSLCLVCCSLVVGLTGCGGGAAEKPLPNTVPVSGSVTMKGKPLVSATVTFVPQGETKGVECVGFTDESGKFKLKQVRGGEGAPPGSYKVVINHFVKGDGSPIKIDGSEPPANLGAVESLPIKYSSFLDSKLTAQVNDAGGEFTFDLK